VGLLWVYYGFIVGLPWVYHGFTVGLLWVYCPGQVVDDSAESCSEEEATYLG